MPSEDSLAEPVPTSHFTGQQGQGPRLGPAPYPLLALLLPVTTAGARPYSILVPSISGHWGCTGINPSQPNRVPALPSSPGLGEVGRGRQG